MSLRLKTSRSSRRRISGVLLPLTALPSSGGIGTLGPAAFAFVDWLVAAGQRAWQILPLSIPDSVGSPYSSSSKSAGNWLLISAERLLADGLLPSNWHVAPATTHVHYRTMWRQAWRMIRVSYAWYLEQASSSQRRRFARFQHQQRAWLGPYTMFQALKDRHRQQAWWTWAKQWRTPTAAVQHLDRALRHQMLLHAYAQWLWYEQWDALHRYARRRGVSIIGDLPFFIRADSVDVWAYPELFLLRSNGQPAVVAGVPPDDFAISGQRWGNPQYNWPAHRRQQWRWWIERFRLLRTKVDQIRFDHFRGLVHTWHVPAGAKTAKRGQWKPSPGRELLTAARRRVPALNLIAEDLGPEAHGADELRQSIHAPTIRLWLFGWNGMSDNPHALTAIKPDTVLYSSNHDTNTVTGWWRAEAKWYERKHVRQQVGAATNIARQAIMSCLESRADTVILAAADILGLGATGRMNRPGRKRGNWSWRLRPGQLTATEARWLRTATRQANRL